MIYVFANSCTTCNAKIAAAIKIVRDFCNDSEIEFEKCSTRYGGRCAELASQYEAFKKGNFQPFITYGQKTIPLKDVTEQKLIDLVWSS